MRRPFSSGPIAHARSRHRQEGAALVLFAICLIVLIGAVGLAIDASVAYSAKARLSLAADSAVLAAADVYLKDTNPATRKHNAEDAAYYYFAQNYPSGFLGTAAPMRDLQIETGPHEVVFKYSASTNSPLTLARVLSSNPLAPSVSPVVRQDISTTREDVDLLIIGSPTDNLSVSAWKQSVVPSIMSNYLDRLDPNSARVAYLTANQRPRLGPNVPVVPFDPDRRGFDRAAMHEKLMNMSSSSGGQFLAWAMVTAAQQMDLVANDGAQKIILVINSGFMDEENAHGTENGQMLQLAESLHEQGVSIYAFIFGDFDGLSYEVVLDGKHEEWYSRDIMACMSGDKDAVSLHHASCPVAYWDGSKYCEAREAAGMAYCLIDAGKESFSATNVLIE
jgi:Flp pilus assembly protein TadG